MHECFLHNRTQFVIVNGYGSGEPQGSVLAPILCLIYINDLPELAYSSVRLFADDCVIHLKLLSQPKFLASKLTLTASLRGVTA